MALKPGTRLGPFEIVGPIGAGGMGEVYRARDERLSREVAIKVLPASYAGDPEKLRRFEQEARATGQLNHPNILVVYDTGTHEGAPYVVEELLEGETLRAKMGGTPLPARKVVDYAGQIARGLAAAHQKGIVHRDLKPENLFVTTDGRVKILDFGLAKLVRPDTAQALLTQAPTQGETGAGVVLGTIGYMSPEQVRGQPVDHRSDIFSFGSVLYEMITGRRPFQAPSSVETMNAILKEDPAEVSKSGIELPAGLERIVTHCMEKSPDERFQSARDLAFQIDALSSQSVSTSARMEAAPARSKTRIAPAIAAAAALLALAGGFAAGRWTRQAPEATTYSQITYRQGSIGSARFTPDGGSIIYSAAWDGGPMEIYSARPGSPESRSLGLPAADILGLSASGEMAILLDPHVIQGFERVGTLARASLSGGVPRQILESVQDADWTPDGSDLAVVSVADGRYRIEYPVGKILYQCDGWIDSLRFSRDGKRLGFIEHPLRGDSRGLVEVVDLQGKATKLTDDFSSAGGLAWSPTGTEIWFTAGKSGNVQAVYGIDLQGRQREIDGAPASMTLEDVGPSGRVLVVRSSARRGVIGLAPGEKAEKDLSWLDWTRPSVLSDDGRLMLFEEQGQGGGPNYSVYLRGTDGSPAVRLGDGYSVALSPDGKWAATIPLDHVDRLVLLPRGPGEPRTLAMDGLALAGSARWSPDGRRIFIQASEGSHIKKLYAVDVATGARTTLPLESPTFSFDLSPSGDLIAAVGTDLAPGIYPADGGEKRPLPGVEPDEVILRWSGDGRSLLVAKPHQFPYHVDRVELPSGRRSPLKDLMPGDHAGLLDISYAAFSADGESYLYSYRKFLSTLYLVEGLR